MVPLIISQVYRRVFSKRPFCLSSYWLPLVHSIPNSFYDTVTETNISSAYNRAKYAFGILLFFPLNLLLRFVVVYFLLVCTVICLFINIRSFLLLFGGSSVSMLAAGFTITIRTKHTAHSHTIHFNLCVEFVSVFRLGYCFFVVYSTLYFVHLFRFSFENHNCAFSASAVIKPEPIIMRL